MNAATSNVFINKCSLDKYLTESMQYRHKVASMKHAWKQLQVSNYIGITQKAQKLYSITKHHK